ncbi:hypothetical protein CLOM_g920 [Closterium sp. NIES-68]|nr:hypothetical protein CLOM_g920 [Closterium sp. NIES-68]GJP74547.1 hypothetical protein CLOP_g5109 [Closterium sp. NIES-67]
MASQLGRVACRVSSPAAGLGSEDEDWLLSYLASTAYGRDPRLNLATTKVRVSANLRSAGNCRTSLSTALPRAPGRADALPGRFSLALPALAAANMAVDLLVEAGGAIGRDKLRCEIARDLVPLCTADSARADDAQAASGDWCAQSTMAGLLPSGAARLPLASTQLPRLRALQADLPADASAKPARVESVSPSDNFDRWVATGGAQRARRKSMMAQRGLAAGGGRLSMQGPRMSMSGRRQSMDYSELDAVRERLQHAANMWALEVQDEQEGDSDDEDERDEGIMDDTSTRASPSAVASSPSSSTGTAAQGARGRDTSGKDASRRVGGARKRLPSGGAAMGMQGFLSRWIHKVAA